MPLAIQIVQHYLLQVPIYIVLCETGSSRGKGLSLLYCYSMLAVKVEEAQLISLVTCTFNKVTIFLRGLMFDIFAKLAQKTQKFVPASNNYY